MLGILLAAGSSTRFGSDKLQQPLPHGVTIAVQAARHLKASVPRVLAVVRPGENTAASALRGEGCEVVICERASEGMGASLACAARAGGAVDGYVIALGDMPFVRPSTITAISQALAAGALLAAPYFHTYRGHPVGVAARFRKELEALSGDEGAKHLLAAHEQDLVKIPVGDPGVIRDIDRPEDLARPPRV